MAMLLLEEELDNMFACSNDSSIKQCEIECNWLLDLHL